MGPADILAESFRLIEQEVGEHPFAAPEWQVVRRMIHASGDLELARSVRFHNNPVAAGLRALRQGAPLVTDVRMVAAGLNQQLLRVHNVVVHCFIDDPEVERRARETGQTRSHWAMEKAVATVGRAVYVVGNAPTALLALCAAVRRGAVSPHLVLALPVGFVAVVESKEQALALGVPVISITGRKGGSAVAAAAMNALLEMAAPLFPAKETR